MKFAGSVLYSAQETLHFCAASSCIGEHKLEV
jgi:hypothetical protein